MAESRLVPCNLMSWPQIRDLLPDQKLVVYHLWATSPSSAGCWLVDYGNFQGALSITRDALETAFQYFADRGLISLDESTGEVFVNDWFRWHKFPQGPRERLLVSDLSKIRSSRLKKIVEKAFTTMASPLREGKVSIREGKFIKGREGGPGGAVPAAGAADKKTSFQQQEKVKTKTGNQSPTDAPGAAFLSFREAYPPARRGAVDKVWKIWQALELEEAPDVVDKMIKGLNAWKSCENWQKEGGKYIVGMDRFLTDKLWLTPPPTSRHFNLNKDEKWEGAEAMLGMSLGEMMRAQKAKVQAAG